MSTPVPLHILKSQTCKKRLKMLIWAIIIGSSLCVFSSYIFPLILILPTRIVLATTYHRREIRLYRIYHLMVGSRVAFPHNRTDTCSHGRKSADQTWRIPRCAQTQDIFKGMFDCLGIVCPAQTSRPHPPAGPRFLDTTWRLDLVDYTAIRHLLRQMFPPQIPCCWCTISRRVGMEPSHEDPLVLRKVTGVIPASRPTLSLILHISTNLMHSLIFLFCR